jgi:GNAT superfamily N-acetyltransferase
MELRELAPGETRLAWEALVELRPHLKSVDELVDRVDLRQRHGGYRLVGAFVGDDELAAGVAGFRVGESLAWGRFLYVDDLVVRSERRRLGCGQALLSWLEEEAHRAGCEQLHLDSGVGPRRHAAHRLYLASGLAVNSLHFDRRLVPPLDRR